MPAATSAPVSSLASRLGVAALTLVAVSVCAWLGLWQWDRAHVRAEQTAHLAPVPLAELIAVGQAPGGAVGRAATVEGRWGSEFVTVPGREIDGVAATLLVAPLSVADGATGQDATLAVIVGWAPTADVPALPRLADGAYSGWLRASEGPAPIERDSTPATSTAVSTAALAQWWPAPVYSPVLVLDDGAGPWQPLPRPEPGSRLNFQSLAYAAEWWVFGVFALVVGVRWVRDNGRTETAKGNRD